MAGNAFGKGIISLLFGVLNLDWTPRSLQLLIFGPGLFYIALSTGSEKAYQLEFKYCSWIQVF